MGVVGAQLNRPAGNPRDQSGEGIRRRSVFRYAALRFMDHIANARKNRFLGGRSGEIRLWPKKRVPYFLILSQRPIGAFDYSGGVAVGAVQQENGARLGVAVPFEADHDAITNAGLRSQGFFQILRVNIHAGRSDDDVFPAAFEIQAASLVGLRDVSRPEPSIGFSYRQCLPILLVGCRDVFASHKDLAILINTHFHAWKHFADGALRGTEWMVQTDEGSGFRHPVSLDDGITQSIPKRLGLLLEHSASRDEGPEFPAEARVDPAEPPPAPEKMLPLHQGETLSKLFDSPFTLLLPLDLALQRLNETRNRNDDRDPLSPDCVHEL